jgi:hypothetical protein
VNLAAQRFESKVVAQEHGFQHFAQFTQRLVRQVLDSPKSVRRRWPISI